MGVRMYTQYVFPTPPLSPGTPLPMRKLISAHRFARVCVADMEDESREYIRAFCISAALVTVAAALPSFIL